MPMQTELFFGSEEPQLCRNHLIPPRPLGASLPSSPQSLSSGRQRPAASCVSAPPPSLLHCQHRHTCACGGERNVHGAKWRDLGLIIRLTQPTDVQMSGRRVCFKRITRRSRRMHCVKRRGGRRQKAEGASL